MDDDKKGKKGGSNASTSKIEERNNNSGREDLDDEEQEIRSNSYGSESSVYSGVSGIDIANIVAAVSKVPSAMKKGADKRDATVRQVGRVQKRRVRANGRRPNGKRPRNPPNARRNKRNRNGLAGTTARGKSKANIQVCQNCGHQCFRRFKVQRRRMQVRKVRRSNFKRAKKKRIGRRNKWNLISGLASIQAGSRSKMLSPLFLQSNDILTEINEEPQWSCEITLKMIWESLKKLGMWTQAVETSTILNHLKKNYPVNCDDDDLQRELLEKLQAATIAGIITQVSPDRWELSREIDKRKFAKNHVTQFWETYGDTMRSIVKPNGVAEREEKENASTSVKSNGEI